MVADSQSTAHEVSRAVAQDGRRVEVSALGPEAARRALEGDFDLVVVEHTGAEDLDFVRRLHSKRPEARVLVLTASGGTESSGTESRIAGLDAGADAVLALDNGLGEIVAQVAAILRRLVPDESCRVEVEEGLVVDTGRLQVERGGRTIDLTPLESGILDHMLRHGHRVVTRSELLQAVWGSPDQQACERTVDVHIVALRRKLSGGSGSQRLIRTVRGRGYRWGG